MIEAVRGFLHNENFEKFNHFYEKTVINRLTLPTMKGESQFPLSPRKEEDEIAEQPKYLMPGITQFD